MNEQVYIDGIDISSRFGVVIPEGGADDFFLYPALKEPKKVSWPEHDGVEVDLETPVIKAGEIELSFVAADPVVDPADFVFFLSEPGYRKVRVFGRERQLRLTEGTKNETWWQGSSKFSLLFTEDSPVLYDPADFTPGMAVDSSGYSLDNVPLNDYGLVIMEGMDELLKAPTTKKNLLRNLAQRHGQMYDAEAHYFNSKEVTFKCCLMAKNMENFWNCYDAFFRDLTAPWERLLYLDKTGEDYPCYYREMSSPKLVALYPYVALTFKLVLEFTVFRIGKSEYLLTAETEEFLILEDDSDGDIYIDLEDF